MPLSRMSRLLLLLLLPAACWADPSTDFGVAACRVLQQSLQSGEPVYSDTVLARLQRATDLPQAEVRLRLAAALDSLAAYAGRRSGAWKDMAALGGVDVPPESASRFLAQAVEQVRPALAPGHGYLLDPALLEAAHRARIRSYQGRDYLLRLLERRLNQTTSADSALGFVVSGSTSRYEVNVDPLKVFFGSQDEAHVLEQVREIHRFIVPALVRELPRWPRVRWAVRDRDATALVDPDYELDFVVEGLHFTGTNADLRPCVDGHVDLLARPSRQAVKTWPIQYCTEHQGSASTHVLDPFYEELAGHVRGLAADFLGQ